VTDLGVVLFDLHVRIGIGSAVLVENQRVATDKALGIFRAGLHADETPITRPAPALGDRLRNDGGGRVWSDVDHLGSCVLMLAISGEGNRKHLTMSAGLHQPDSRVLHGQPAPQVAVDPFHRGVAISRGSLGNEIEHVVGPVLNGRVTAPTAFLDDDLDHGGVKRVGRVCRGRAAFDIVNVCPLVDDDQSPLELAHVLRVDPEIGLKRLIDMNARRHIDEGSARPNRTVERSELVVIRRYDRSEVLLDQVRVFAQGCVHVGEQHTELLQVFSVAVINDFGLVLGGNPGQVLPFGFRDAKLLVGLLDGLGHHVPILLLLTFGLDVVVDVVEVDGVQRASTTPLRDGLAKEPLVSLEPEVEHPLGLTLHGGHRADDLLVESLAGLEGQLHFVLPTELIPA